MSDESLVRDCLANLIGILKGTAYAVPAGKTRDLMLAEAEGASRLLSRTNSEFVAREFFKPAA